MVTRTMDHPKGRWSDLDKLLTRQGALAGSGFEPSPQLRQFLHEDCRVLVVGAGGLGCELLKDLVFSGFGKIDVIDMDTIDATNLNRQFLFRPSDVGLSKAKVAARRLSERVHGVSVTPHHAAIQDLPREFYADFQVIVLGLDSLEARRYMNSISCSFLEYNDDGSPDLSTVKPLVDGGTEGLKGHARVLLPGITPCFECTLWLFPPQTKFPLCTLAETPRSPAHCIEYAKIVLWPRERPNESFDADDESHMRWVFEAAERRAAEFGIQGVTYRLTQGVTKNIIPAIASTNALIAAVCSLEVLKLATMCSTGLNNYLMYEGPDEYAGSEGIYTLTSEYDRDESCPVCSPGVPLDVDPNVTLSDLLQLLVDDPTLGPQLGKPSVSVGSRNLYLRGALESTFAGNLSKKIGDLVEPGEEVLTVNDRRLPAPIKVRLRWNPHRVL